jgi:hypothetical protein
LGTNSFFTQHKCLIKLILNPHRAPNPFLNKLPLNLIELIYSVDSYDHEDYTEVMINYSAND